MKKYLVSLSIAGALFAIPAKAEDMGAYNWSGWYGGAFIGYSHGDLDAAAFHFTAPIEDDGFVAGLLGGYRMQQPNDVVYGVQLSVPVLAEEGSSTTGIGGSETVELKFGALVTGQVGRAYGPWLPLVSVGGGFVIVESTNTTGTPSSQHVTHPAFTAGLGVNYRVSEMVAVGARYNYTKVFRKAHVTNFNAGVDNEFGADIHSFGAVIEILFGQ